MKNNSGIWMALGVVGVCAIGIGVINSGSDVEATDPMVEQTTSQAEPPAPPVEAEIKITTRSGNPGPRPEPPAQQQDPINLWDEKALRKSDEGYDFTVDTKFIKNLQVGQSLQLSVPELGEPITAKITKTHNRFGNNNVFSADVEGNNNADNVTIVRGQNVTFLTVMTLNGMYGARIDNSTGDARMWNGTAIQ